MARPVIVGVKGRVLACIVLLIALASSAWADLDVRVEKGHRERWIIGAATPVTVTLENTGDVAVEVSLDLGSASALGGSGRQTRTVFVGPGSERREVLLLSGPSGTSTLELVVQTSPRTTIHHARKSANKGVITISLRDEFAQDQSATIEPERRVIGTVFDRTNALATVLPRAQQASAQSYYYGDQEQFSVLSVDARHLAFAPLVLDRIDTLVVCNPDASFAAEPAVLDGLLDWVALGGHLVVSLGSEAATFGASPLAGHLPGRWTGVDRAFYPDLLPILVEDSGSLPQRQGPFAAVEAVDGKRDRLVTNDRGQVVLATRLFGQGSISLVPVDLTIVAPMLLENVSGSKQPALNGLIEFLAPLRVPLMGTLDATAAMTGMDGRIDIDGSLKHTLTKDAFTPPPMPLVVLALALYVVVVGPLDWMILKRIKKERLTTLTFTAAVTIFTVLAYGASFLLFSSGEVVNRVVLVDLTDGGRDGRELLRVMDIAGYYAPTGNELVLDYEADSLVVPGSLPTTLAGGSGAGTDLPMITVSKTPLRSRSVLPISFRSQRTVRGVSIRPAGRSIDAVWVDTGGAARQLELTNGLAIDLRNVFVVLPNNGGVVAFDGLASGATKMQTARKNFETPGGAYNRSNSVIPEPDELTADDVFGFFAFLSQAHYLATRRSSNPFARLTGQEMATLLKTGVDRSSSLERGSALLIAYAHTSPVPLPESESEGKTYVIIRKEIPLP